MLFVTINYKIIITPSLTYHKIQQKRDKINIQYVQQTKKNNK